MVREFAQWITCFSTLPSSTPRTPRGSHLDTFDRRFGQVWRDQASDGRKDVYDAGSLSWNKERGIVLNESHDRKQPIKRFSPYIEGDEVRVDFPLPPTQRGRDAATMVKDGTYSGLSMEVSRDSIVATYRAGIRHISRGKLVGAALVDEAAFLGSVVDVHAKREVNHLGVLAWL